jgi:hypothetical protein
MAKYRQVHTHIWKDGWFLDLEPAHKLFFIYLFSNERASISGIYELPKRVMSFESGLTLTEIQDAFNAFAEAGKALYQDGVVWVVNLRKYHETKSPKVQKCILDDVERVKDCELKGIYMQRYGIDRVSSVEDTLDIPRSSSSISSSNGSGSEETMHTQEMPGPPSTHDDCRQEMVSHIGGAVKDTYAIGLNSDKFEQVADALIDQGITTEQVDAFPAWWSANGHYEGRPALKSLLDNIKESIAPAVVTDDWGSDAKVYYEPKT